MSMPTKIYRCQIIKRLFGTRHLTKKRWTPKGDILCAATFESAIVWCQLHTMHCNSMFQNPYGARRTALKLAKFGITLVWQFKTMPPFIFENGDRERHNEAKKHTHFLLLATDACWLKKLSTLFFVMLKKTQNNYYNTYMLITYYVQSNGI